MRTGREYEKKNEYFDCQVMRHEYHQYSQHKVVDTLIVIFPWCLCLFLSFFLGIMSLVNGT